MRKWPFMTLIYHLREQWAAQKPIRNQRVYTWPKCRWVTWLWVWWPMRAHEASLCEPHLQPLSHLLPLLTALQMMKCSDLLTSDTFHLKPCDATAFYIKCISYEQHFPFLSFGHRVNASLLQVQHSAHPTPWHFCSAHFFPGTWCSMFHRRLWQRQSFGRHSLAHNQQ